MCVCVCIIYNAKKNFPLFEILSLELLTTLFCFFFACILFLSSFLCLFFLYFLVTSGFYPRLAILLHCLSFFLSIFILASFLHLRGFIPPFFCFYSYPILTCTCLFFFNAISFQQFSLHLGIIG